MLVAEADAPVATHANGNERVSFSTNKIGGKPIWPASQPPLQALQCDQCQAHLTQVIQIYAPQNDSVYHRVLHVFVCCDCAKSRVNSWKILRTQAEDAATVAHLEAEAKKAAALKNQKPATFGAGGWGVEGADDWGDNDDDGASSEWDNSGVASGWGNTDTGTQPSNDWSVSEDTSLEKSFVNMDLSTSQQSEKLSNLQSDAVEPEVSPEVIFTGLYLNAYSEPDKVSPDEYTHEQKLLEEYVNQGGNIGGVTSSDDATMKFAPEVYEDIIPKHGDVVFAKFKKRIQRAPAQCVRYDRGGDFIRVTDRSEGPPSALPPCPKCGAPREFELQILPALIYQLKPQSGCNFDTNRISVANVVVFTCSDSCWADGSRAIEEFVYVQEDPDAVPDAFLRDILLPQSQ